MPTNPNRRPPGTPAGGQYAPTTHPRPSFELEADEPTAPTVRPRAAAWPDDPIAGRLDPAEVADRLGFDRLDPGVRSHYPILGPVSITAETRQGVKGFRVADTRSWASIRVASKRTANRIAKLIDDDLHQATGARRRPTSGPRP